MVKSWQVEMKLATSESTPSNLRISLKNALWNRMIARLSVLPILKSCPLASARLQLPMAAATC